jgi:flagellar M-ring protein FliF
MGLFQKINTIWDKVGLVQKALLAAIVIACAITGALLTKWASQPDMRLLFGNMDLKESAEICDKISEQDIPYEIRGGGKSIYVPAEKVHLLRASLARDGLLPRDGEPGYEVFDDQGVGVSPFLQKMNYNRAIQGELARTIQVFEGIEFARIHVVRPEQTMFTADGQAGSASVMLRLKPGFRLSNTTVTAISNLVAGAIEGLSPDQVTISDSNGNMLSGQYAGDSVITSANNYSDYEKAVEGDMSRRLTEALETVLGPSRVAVMAKARIDMTKETMVKTIYEKGIAMEETIEESKTVKNSVVDEEGNEKTPGSQETTGTTTSMYKIPETTTTISKVPGKVLGWSVSVMVDLKKDAPPVNLEANSETPSNTTETSGEELIMQVEDVIAIIQTAIGPDLLKDEDLTVKQVSFNRPQTAILTESSTTLEKMAPILEIVRQSSLGLLAICALLVLKIFTGAGKKATAEHAEISAGQILMASGGPMLPAGSGEEAMTAIRQQITQQLRDNPEQVRHLFASWLSEDK